MCVALFSSCCPGLYTAPEGRRSPPSQPVVLDSWDLVYLLWQGLLELELGLSLWSARPHSWTLAKHGTASKPIRTADRICKPIRTADRICMGLWSKQPVGLKWYVSDDRYFSIEMFSGHFGEGLSSCWSGKIALATSCFGEDLFLCYSFTFDRSIDAICIRSILQTFFHQGRQFPCANEWIDRNMKWCLASVLHGGNTVL